MNTMIVRNRDGSKQRIYSTDFDASRQTALTGAPVPDLPERVSQLVTGSKVSERAELEARADELGIRYHPNIGDDRLAARIKAAERP